MLPSPVPLWSCEPCVAVGDPGRSSCRRPGGRRRPRSAAEGTRPAPQLPAGRARALPARGARARAASVPRGGEQRGASLHPRPAALGVCVGEEARTTTSASGPTTTSSTPPATRSSTTRNSAGQCRRPRPTAGQEVRLPSAKVLGGPRGRRKPSGPKSVVNISAMSYGSLSGAAVEALNRARPSPAACTTPVRAACRPTTAAAASWSSRSGRPTSGVATRTARFDLQRLKDLVAGAPVRALEVKLSQGAKPGLGGVLPGAKVSEEIAAARGVRVGRDCISPSRHAEFSDVDSLLDWVEMLADETGLPVGIKSAVGDMTFWEELTDLMARTGRGVDFVTVDGGEGGTGAAPLIFTDSVSLPFQLGFSRVYRALRRAWAARAGDVHRRRQAGAAGQRGGRLRPGVRHGQRGAGGDAGDRLHPGPEVPHRHLPHRRGHPEPVADQWADPNA